MIVYKIKELMQIKRNNEGKSLTYQDVAAGSGVSAVTISRMLNGKVKPSADVLEKLCRYFDCGFDDLMRRIDDSE